MQMALLLPRLEHAVFHGCEAVSDELLEHAASVKLLDCAFTAVGDAGLHSLAQVPPMDPSSCGNCRQPVLHMQADATSLQCQRADECAVEKPEAMSILELMHVGV